MIPGQTQQFFEAAAAQSGAAAGYEITRSLRFNSADSAYLNRTPSSAGNRKLWTLSFWYKPALEGTQRRHIFTARNASNHHAIVNFRNSEDLEIYYYDGALQFQVLTTPVYRDPSAWYHFTIIYDTDQTTASDRIKVYSNSIQVTDFAVASYPSLGYANAQWNNNVAHAIGKDDTNYLSGYLADIHFIDGQALAPTDFGEYDDNNVWQPKEYAGTYGTNGFHLDFSDNSSDAALGTDSSGNNNTWTVNNLNATTPDELVIPSNEVSTSGSVTDPLNLFDGDVTSTISSSDGSRIYWTPTSNISVTKFEVYFTSQYNGYKIGIEVTGGNSQIITKDTSGSGNAPGWVEFTSITGTIGPSNQVMFRSYRSDDTDPGILGISAVRVNDELVTTTSLVYKIDSLIDTPTNYEAASGNNGGNYCTWNPLAVTPSYQASSLTNGNLDAYVTGNSRNAYSTIAFPSSGKYFFEVTLDGSFSGAPIVGVSAFTGTSNAYPSSVTTPSVVYNWDGTKTVNGSTTSYGATYGAGDVIGVAVDIDSSTVTFYKNGSSQGSISLNVAEAMPHVGSAGATGTYSLNAGQRPFAYTPPTGYKSLCTTNLTDPTIADGSTAMDVALWTGNSTARDITGFNMSPDLAWIKKRNSATFGNHHLFDTVRGATLALISNDTQAEQTETTQLTAFNSDGFSLGTSPSSNATSDTYVAWAWDAGSSTVSNTDGTITSSVRANASAGFSIVSYTGTGSAGTVGHGLNADMGMVITKTRESSNGWIVWHKSLSSSTNNYLQLNLTDAVGTLSNYWGSGGVTNSVFGLGTYTGNNTSNEDMIAYCFAPVEGYSAFGSYTGNGLADGPFVFTGMRPRWIMVKRYDGLAPWVIVDTERNTFNVMDNHLLANDSAAENGSTIGNICDSVSNGFKFRGSDGWFNGSSADYIYAAFAEHPFKTARAR